jgi:hypothetical protein
LRPGDWFLRRVARWYHIKGGAVHWKAFRPEPAERALSYTLQNDDLRTPNGLDQYQLYWVFPSGDLPGICKLSYVNLTEDLKPPLPPWPEPDETDKKYGHLHCHTDLPRDKDSMRRLAVLATENGVVRPFVEAAARQR